ncbi:hypothetical protein ES332_D04G183500v1 [Gossypium tomentosum]|uniref:Uncharacterized protein n=1 Tax=Gossypium tomentosum TaxID=34277 RepID=A0A5D2LEP6_GOSTO|nr:hypothetical protein ES332_D04G183500v1 [Gossypium tomentosum]
MSLLPNLQVSPLHNLQHCQAYHQEIGLTQFLDDLVPMNQNRAVSFCMQ